MRIREEIKKYKKRKTKGFGLKRNKIELSMDF